MKKRLPSIFPFVFLILVLCIAIYYAGFYKREAVPLEEYDERLSETDTFVDDTDTFIEESDTFVEDTTTLNQPTSPPSTGLSKESEVPVIDSELYEETSTTPISKDALRQLSAGTILDIDVGDALMEHYFYSEEITDDIKLRIAGKSYKDDCTVPFEDLNYVRVLYYGFDKEIHIGELIVNVAIAEDIVAIFAELFEAKYPIEEMVLVDEYNADDNASMAANNTSSFNYRTVPGATHLSKHALGLAIDVNPLYNPFVQYNEAETIVLPVEGIPYADRTLDCPYYIDEDDLCYQAFTKRGFTWGGFWESEPDYQHFQKAL